jgi:hypothetical protein
MSAVIRQRRRGNVTAAGAAGLALGAVLFAYTLSRSGTAAAWHGAVNIGVPGFALVLLLSGIRLAARARAWVQCFDGPVPLRFRDAFTATLIAEALANLTPFSTAISEPAKAVLVRDRVPLAPALSAIVIENIFYTASVAAMIALGAGALLAAFHPGGVVRWAGYAALAAVSAVLAIALAVLTGGLRPATRTLRLLRRWRAPAWVTAAEARVSRFETGINQFCARHRDRLLPLLLLQACFHAAGVAEVYVILTLATRTAGSLFLSSLVLESAGRVVNALFEFIPMRVGVDEAGAAALTAALRLGAASGVALALVRKARMLVWTGVGLALLAARGLSPRTALIQAEATAMDPADILPKS